MQYFLMLIDRGFNNVINKIGIQLLYDVILVKSCLVLVTISNGGKLTLYHTYNSVDCIQTQYLKITTP